MPYTPAGGLRVASPRPPWSLRSVRCRRGRRPHRRLTASWGSRVTRVVGVARLALGFMVALLLAGCGGDDDGAAVTTTATPQQSALRTHMLVEGDIDGIDPVAPVRVTKPEDWITDSGHVNAEQVRASGFVEGMRQQITSGAGVKFRALQNRSAGTGRVRVRPSANV